MSLFFRPKVASPSLTPSIREAVKAVSPDIPPPTVRTMDGRLSDALFAPRFRLYLVGVFALVALVLSTAGLYGVMTFFVRARTPEIGIRRALGAPAAATAGLVFKQGLALVAGGVLIGLVGVVVAGRVIDGWLYGLGSWDPVAFGGASAFLAIVAVLACTLPMNRAAKVDPAVVLNSE